MDAKRLTKLADYLYNLEEGFWDFSNVTNASNLQQLVAMCSKDGDCGTTGCALGHLPCIWPDTFRWYLGSDGCKFYPVYKENESAPDMPKEDVEEFFDITSEQWEYFFQPGGDFGLDRYASQYDVADRIKHAIQYGFPDFEEMEEDEDWDA